MDAYTQQGKHQFLCLILLNMSTSVSADCLCEDVAMPRPIVFMSHCRA